MLAVEEPFRLLVLPVVLLVLVLPLGPQWLHLIQ
jgi:hypothetical protein